MAGRSFCMVYALIGIPLGLVMFQSIGERLNTFVGWALKHAKRCFKTRNPEVTQTNLVMVVLVLSTILMTSMAAVFAKYERWEYFDALYYCFITLTTIGFGDYVALQKDSALQSKPEYVALSLIFILFGLSVVSSAVNLLVLKFLTLNTEDERRDEQMRYSAAIGPATLVEGDVITTSAGKLKLLRPPPPGSSPPPTSFAAPAHAHTAHTAHAAPATNVASLESRALCVPMSGASYAQATSDSDGAKSARLADAANLWAPRLCCDQSADDHSADYERRAESDGLAVNCEPAGHALDLVSSRAAANWCHFCHEFPATSPQVRPADNCCWPADAQLLRRRRRARPARSCHQADDHDDQDDESGEHDEHRHAQEHERDEHDEHRLLQHRQHSDGSHYDDQMIPCQCQLSSPKSARRPHAHQHQQSLFQPRPAARHERHSATSTTSFSIKTKVDRAGDCGPRESSSCSCSWLSPEQRCPHADRQDNRHHNRHLDRRQNHDLNLNHNYNHNHNHNHKTQNQSHSEARRWHRPHAAALETPHAPPEPAPPSQQVYPSSPRLLLDPTILQRQFQLSHRHQHQQHQHLQRAHRPRPNTFHERELELVDRDDVLDADDDDDDDELAPAARSRHLDNGTDRNRSALSLAVQAAPNSARDFHHRAARHPQRRRPTRESHASRPPTAGDEPPRLSSKSVGDLASAATNTTTKLVCKCCCQHDECIQYALETASVQAAPMDSPRSLMAIESPPSGERTHKRTQKSSLSAAGDSREADESRSSMSPPSPQNANIHANVDRSEELQNASISELAMPARVQSSAQVQSPAARHSSNVSAGGGVVVEARASPLDSLE